MKLCCFSFRYSLISLRALITIAFLMMTACVQAQFFDSYSIEAGKGTELRVYKLGAQKWMSNNYSFLADNNLHPYWELSIADWRERKYQNVPGQSKSITDIGLTPVLRWQKNNQEGIFAEAGVGLNHMLESYDNAGKVAGSSFQFGSHFGFGYKFSNSFEASVKVQHYSNAGIRHPNPAINVCSIKIAYTF